MNKQLSILFLTTQLPYPPVSGGVLKSYYVLKYMLKNYNVRLCCLLKNDDEENLQKFKEEFPGLEIHSMAINIKRSPLNLLFSYFLNIPLNLYRNYSKEFKKVIKSLSLNADILFIDHYEMFQYVPENFKRKVILHQHNAEHLIWERSADYQPNLVKKWILLFESKRIKAYEVSICERSHRVLAAPNDIEVLVKAGCDNDKFIVTYHLGHENLMDLPALKFSETKKQILYVGTLSWEANIDGLIWFIKEIWEIIISNDPDVKLIIIGKNPDKRLLRAAEQYGNIEFKGFQADLEPFYKNSRVFIAPLRFGSGMKVKVIEALSRGIPTVTTTIGIEGLEVENEKDIFYSDNPEKFANDVVKLLHDKILWSNINVSGRELIQSKYTWEKVQ